MFGSVRKPADAERLREDSAGTVTPVLFDLADAGSVHRAAAEVSSSVGAHGVNAIVNPTTFKGITSHDLKIGVRWDLSNPPVYQPPLIRKG